MEESENGVPQGVLFLQPNEETASLREEHDLTKRFRPGAVDLRDLLREQQKECKQLHENVLFKEFQDDTKEKQKRVGKGYATTVSVKPVVLDFKSEGQARMWELIRQTAIKEEREFKGVWAAFGQPYLPLGKPEEPKQALPILNRDLIAQNPKKGSLAVKSSNGLSAGSNSISRARGETQGHEHKLSSSQRDVLPYLSKEQSFDWRKVVESKQASHHTNQSLHLSPYTPSIRSKMTGKLQGLLIADLDKGFRSNVDANVNHPRDNNEGGVHTRKHRTSRSQTQVPDEEDLNVIDRFYTSLCSLMEVQRSSDPLSLMLIHKVRSLLEASSPLNKSLFLSVLAHIASFTKGCGIHRHNRSMLSLLSFIAKCCNIPTSEFEEMVKAQGLTLVVYGALEVPKEDINVNSLQESEFEFEFKNGVDQPSREGSGEMESLGNGTADAAAGEGS